MFPVLCTTLKGINKSKMYLSVMEYDRYEEMSVFLLVFSFTKYNQTVQLGDKILLFTVSCSCNRNSSTNSVCHFCLQND